MALGTLVAYEGHLLTRNHKIVFSANGAALKPVHPEVCPNSFEHDLPLTFVAGERFNKI
jgi:hypothetical protein